MYNLFCLFDTPSTTQIDPRYVTKRNRFVYTNSKLGDAGFSNSVQRCDLQANGGTAWQTHVRALGFSSFHSLRSTYHYIHVKAHTSMQYTMSNLDSIDST